MPSLLVASEGYVELTGQCGIIECCTEEGSYYLLAISRVGLNLPTFFRDWRAALSHSYNLLRTRQDAARVSAPFPAPSCFSPFLRCSSLFQASSVQLGFGHGLWPVGSWPCRRSRFRRLAEVATGRRTRVAGLCETLCSSTRTRSVRSAQWLSC
jgi:hypothetical protein